MFYLSSDMAERIRFDEWAFCHADECIRAAEVPVWQIDAEEFAREQIELLDGFDADNEEEAEARYMDAFRRAHRYALRSAVHYARAPLGPGWVALRGWCGYSADDVAYAIDPIVAAAVWAASALRAREEGGEA
jgi:hypothetical protein